MKTELYALFVLALIAGVLSVGTVTGAGGQDSQFTAYTTDMITGLRNWTGEIQVFADGNPNTREMEAESQHALDMKQNATNYHQVINSFAVSPTMESAKEKALLVASTAGKTAESYNYWLNAADRVSDFTSFKKYNTKEEVAKQKERSFKLFDQSRENLLAKISELEQELLIAEY